MKKNLLLAILFLAGLVFTTSAQTKYVAVQDGYWYSSSTWSPSGIPWSQDTVVIPDGVTVTARAFTYWWSVIDSIPVAKVNVEKGGTLKLEYRRIFGTDYKIKVTVLDSLINNGTVQGDLKGSFPTLYDQNTPIYASKTISGTGGYSIVSLRTNGNVEVTPDAEVNLLYSFVHIRSNDTLFNFGSFKTDFIIKADDATSTWINKANSYVSVGYTMMQGGQLVCNETDNIVEYSPIYANVAATTPVDTIYYNLYTSGSDSTIINTSYLYVNNDLKILGSVFNLQNNKLYVRGNWYDYGDFIGDNSTVIFDGTKNQSIYASAFETFENLKLENSPYLITVASPLIINDTLTLNTVVNCGSQSITIGESLANLGTLNYKSGKIIGEVKRWITSSANPYLFPIGSQNYKTFVNITFPSLASGGVASFVFIDTVPGNDGLPLRDGAGDSVYNVFNDGYWIADTAEGFDLGGNTYSIELEGNTFKAFQIIDSTKIVVRPHQDSIWRFDGIQGTNDPANYIVARNLLDSFPWQFAFADTSNCTPPELTAINGLADVCRGSTDILYTTDTSSVNQFFWTVKGGVITQNLGDSIYVSWENDGQYGSIEVYAQNTCTFGPEISKTVMVHSIPPSELYGPTAVPEGSDSVLYRIDKLSDYSYSGSIIGNGTIDSIAPTQDSAWISFPVAGTDTILVIAQYDNGCPSDTAAFAINVYNVINSVQSGSWYDPSTWDCNCSPLSSDNVRIRQGHTVDIDQITLDGITYYAYRINNVIIESGAKLQRTDAILSISGDIIDDGTIDYRGTNFEISGTDKWLDGLGNIIVDTMVIQGSRNVGYNAFLTIDGIVNIDNNTLYNNGKLIMLDTLVANTGTFVNGKQAEFTIKGELLPTGGELIADSLDNTIIYGGTTQKVIPVSSASAGYYNLVIAGNGTKTASGDLVVLGDFAIRDTGIFDITSNTITLYKDWYEYSTASNPFIEGTGLVLFNGNTDQYIYAPAGETFYDLKIGQNSTLNILPNQHFTVTNNFYIDGLMKMKMQAANDTLPSFIYENDIIYGTNGAVQTDLFINAKSWHEVSPAIIGTTSDAFTKAINGAFNSNFYYYDESMDLDGDPATEPASPFDNSYLAYAWKDAHNGSDGSAVNLNLNGGYMFYVDRDLTISMKGKIAQVSEVYDTTLSFTDNDPDSDGDTLPNLYDGWNLIGNPYTAYLSIDSILNNATNVDNGVYVWDDANGQYAGYQNGFSVLSGRLGNTVPPLQGFFIRANAANASIKIRPEYRVHNKQMYLKASNPYKRNALKLALQANGYTEYMAVYFTNQTLNKYTAKFDLLHMKSNNAKYPQLYSQKGNNSLALLSLPETYLDSTVLPLFAYSGVDGNYTLKTEYISGIDDSFVLIKDLKTDQIYNLRTQNSISFDYSTSDSTHRFDLIIVKDNAPKIADTLGTLYAWEDSTFYLDLENYFKDIDSFDSLTFVINGLEKLKWLAVKDGKLTGTPRQSDVGNFDITIYAVDQLGKSAYQQAKINVLNTNDAPIVKSFDNSIEVYANDYMILSLEPEIFEDPDLDDTLTISSDNLPEWSYIDNSNKVLVGQPGIQNIGEYQVTLKATDKAGAWTETTLNIKVKPKTALNNKDANVYPNPASETINIVTSEVINGDIYIYDLKGQLVKKAKINDDAKTINISDLEAGQYIIELKGKDTNYKLKFTKI